MSVNRREWLRELAIKGVPLPQWPQVELSSLSLAHQATRQLLFNLNNYSIMSDWKPPAYGTPVWMGIPANDVARGMSSPYR